MNHTERTKYIIMVIKHANKYQIIWKCPNFKNVLINDYQHHSFLYQAKVLLTSFFTKPKITN